MTSAAISNLQPIRILHQAIRVRNQRHRDAVTALPNASQLPIWSMSETPELGLKQLPHAIAAAFDAIMRLENAQVVLLARRRSREIRPGATEIQLVEADEANPLLFAIDSYLESAVRAQDGAWRYVHSALAARGLKQSLRDGVEKFRKGSIVGMSAEIRECIISYWDSTGLRLRDYRVLSQHYGEVTSELRIRLTSGEQPSIFLALPSHPEVRKPGRFRYDDPVVLAYPFCKESFFDLVRWLYRLADAISPGVAPPPVSTLQFITAPLMRNNQFVGYSVGGDGEFAKETGQLVQSQNRGEAPGAAAQFVWRMVNRIPE